MGAIASIQLREEDIEEIQNETGFSRHQISRLYSRFTSLDKNNRGVLVRDDFLRIPELAINPLVDRIVHSFFQGSSDDTVNFRDFMRILALFRPIRSDPAKNKLNTLEDKLKFVFHMYDLDGDNRIAREELLAVLHMMVGQHLSDDQIYSSQLDGVNIIAREELLAVLHLMMRQHLIDDQVSIIADHTLAEIDTSHDGMITYEEFAKVAMIASRTLSEIDTSNDDLISFEEFVKAMEKVDVENKMSIHFLH